MEIIQATGSRCYLQFLKPSKHDFPFMIPNRLSPTSITSSSLSLNSSRKLLTTSYSLLDDAVSGSAIKVAEVDPMLAVKKIANDISPGLKGTSIYLVGIKSNIKTRLGKLLADALRYYFFDSDHLVMEAAAKQLVEMDEKDFRETESEVLKQLSSMGRLVVSAGDGAVQSTANLAVLRHGISIWVDVPLEMVAKEVVEDGAPLIIGSEKKTVASHSEVLDWLTMVYKEMQQGYAISDATVSLQKVGGELGYDDVECVTTEDMGLEVLKEIEKLIRVKKMMEEAARPF